MLRYLAIVWNASNADATALAESLRNRISHDYSGWCAVMDAGGLMLFVRRSQLGCYQPHPLCGSSGVVLGVLFDRSDQSRNSLHCNKPFFDETRSLEILASAGRHLVRRYWGRYIAFLHEPATQCTRILRDPIGDLTCFRARVRGVSVYFSRLPDFMHLSCLRLSVNWRHIAARVISGNAWADESALNEVETVHPGECFEHTGEHLSQRFYWRPLEIAKADPIEDRKAAAAEVRTVTLRCAHAWAGLHERAVHVLSGGLDSSVVLACLAHSPSRPRICCINFRTCDPDSDERAYARLAASTSGCGLTEVVRHSSLDLERLLECSPAVGPVSIVMRGLEVQPLVARFARECAATTVFSGDGGDTLFFHGWPQLAVIDYAYAHGFNGSLMRLASGAALPAQLSVWKLLQEAGLYGVLRRKWDVRKILFEHYRLLSRAVVESAWGDLDFLNPWNDPVQDIPPGKRIHAFSMTRPNLFRDPLGGEPALDAINPLVSQPILEVCLRIPTWIHAAGGRDRAVERDAFAADLPPEIVSRTWKGGADRHQDAMLAGNLPLVRELLLDGQLVKHGILERRKVEACVSGAPTADKAHATEVFGYVCTEAWLRHWTPASTRP